MAQNGRATRADSLALYNNALNKIKFYKGNPDYTQRSPETNFKSDEVRKKLIKNYKQEVKSENKVEQALINEINAYAKNANKPLTPAEKSAMEKKINTIKFGKVRDTNLTSFGDIIDGETDTYYNPLSPPIYLHPNISPQGSERYYSDRFGDSTEIPYYDPIAVAPFDVIKNNPKLVAERIKKYGTSGIPKSYLSKTSTKKEIDKPIEVKPELQPRVEALNLRPIEQAPINLPVQELDFNTPIKAPKSYNVNSQRTNVNGINDFYNNVQQGVDYEQALKSKQSADAYNKYIQEKYGNEDALKNPKAVERLKQLRQNVEVTPVFQKGGKVFKKTVSESTAVGKNRIPVSSKDVIKKLPGTNVHTNSKGEIVIKDEKGVYKPIENKQQPEIVQGGKPRSGTQIVIENKQKQAEAKKKILKPLDVTTDVMQLGNFGPNPYLQVIGKIGNVAGGLIDAYQTYDALSEEDYVSAAINAASLALPFGLGSQTFRRNSKYLKPGQPLYPLSPQAGIFPGGYSGLKHSTTEYIEPFTKVRGMTDKSLLANRALLGTLGAETVYDTELIPEYQMGGSIPGSVGFTYARTNSPAPSNGPYAKKTKASAKNGDVIVSDRGQWDHPGKITQIDQSKEGSYIDMGPDPKTGKPITQKILAVSDTGDVKLMMPGGKYKLNGTKVTEYPIAQEGKTITVDEGDGKKRKILTDSKEYADLYNEDRIGVKNDDESISFNPLNEVVVTPYDEQYPFYQELSDEEKKYFNSDSPIGRQIRSKAQDNVGFNADKATDFAMGWLRDLPLASLQAPQSAFVEGVEAVRGNDYNFLDAITPEEQRLPSDVWGIENDYYGVNPLNPMLPPVNYKTIGNTAMDMVGDPETLAGISLVKNPLRIGFNYLNDKGAIDLIKNNQALIKTNEVISPLLNKGKTLIDDMGAVMSREVKTIDPKINAINDAQSALYQTPEYSNYASENLNLRQQRWALEGKINQMKSKGSTSELNELTDKMDKLQKRINVAEQFTVNGEGLVQSGKNTSLGLRTGSTDIMDLATGEKFPISTSVPSEGIIHRLEGDQVIKTIDNSTLPQASPEYGATVKKNIDFIETQIPGAKVFGSAKNVADAEVPHIIGDYDVLMSQSQYDKFAKTNPSVGNNGFAELHNIPGAAKGVEPIDINVIQEKNGKAIGTRAEELFKQMAPDEYYAAAKKAIKDKSEIKIPYSSQQLVDMTDPTTKSVVDAYVSSKDKHLNKIDALINYGKPSVVAEGQQQFVKSLVGSKGSIGHQFPLEQLSNAETNAEILDKIGVIGNKKLVAADPERMQLAINDYYMNNSILARQVEQGKINKIEAAIKEYYPGAGGGAVNGIGQNHVMLGHPFHGDGNIISMKQLGMNLDTKDPMSYINSIEHQVSGEKLFSQEERDILSDILNNMKFNDTQRQFANQSENTSQLIEKLPYSEEGKKALYEFGKQTNRTIVKKSTGYGNSTYASTLRDFDDAIDAMQYQVASSEYTKNPTKSFRQRTEAAESAARNQPTISPEIELLPKQFKAIKGYVEGGMERAKERLDVLSKQKRKISEDIDALSNKAFNKKYKEELDRLKEFRDKIDKEADDMAQMRRDLFDRKIHLNKLEDKMKTVGILGGGGATVVGLGTFAYKQDQQQRKEFDERLKKMTKEERKQFDKDLEERIRKADSLDRIDKPFLDKSYDWFMGRKQNGGTITKAKDGNQLVKLNQLTNFTNYNKPTVGGWLDKY